MNMNTPNKLTLFRVILVPLCLGLMLETSIPHRFLYALVVFLFASYTDYLDGHLARKRGEITNFGKFLDPLADKLLILGVLIVMVELRLCSAAPVMVMLARELAVTSIRLVAAGKGEVVAASSWGKRKMVVQIVAVALIFLLQELSLLGVIGEGFPFFFVNEMLLWIAAMIAILSGILYYVHNKELLNFSE